MRSDNLQLPHVTPNFLMVAMAIMVAMVIMGTMVMVVTLVMVNINTYRTRQGGTGRDGTGQDRTGQDRTKLTFKLDFPGNLCMAAFAILPMFCC